MKTYASSRFLDLALRMLLRFLLPAVFITTATAQVLKFATINVWSGLNYRGVLTLGEYEPADRREQRFQLLVRELRRCQPDVIALQETNPAGSFSSRLARELGYDHICQRVNAGIKLGCVGIPWNFNEGIALLARKHLRLELVDVWSLSSNFGAMGDIISFHYAEENAAVVAKIRLNGLGVYIITTHLPAGIPDMPAVRAKLEEILRQRGETDIARCRALENLVEGAEERMHQVRLLADRIENQCSGVPVVLLGDFNATLESPEIAHLCDTSKLVDAIGAAGKTVDVTWDPVNNTNVRFSRDTSSHAGNVRTSLDLLSTWYDGLLRRIDHVFLNREFRPDDVNDAQVLLDKPEGELYASDHYGAMVTIDFTRLVQQHSVRSDERARASEKGLDVLPIIMYDTDVGFGYGVKAFFLNYAGWRESFDLVAFNSTKGERWYRFVFSIPDFELRQGTEYPLSFDLIVDYDKYLKNNFYGVGKSAKEADRELYTKEPLEILAVFSRGFSPRIVGQVGVKYRTVRNFNFDSTSLFARSLPEVNHGRSSAMTLYGALRYDSRDSYINPSRGQVMQLELEAGGSWLSGDYSVTTATLSLQTFHVLFYPKTVFAGRLWGQVARGVGLPLHALATVGGTRTLRGYPQDRYLDNVAAVANGEIRFPIYWRFGGIVGVDAGQVFKSLSDFDGRDWAVNPVVGLRFYMDTFVVRADLGFGSEATGFYLNFGHLF